MAAKAAQAAATAAAAAKALEAEKAKAQRGQEKRIRNKRTILMQQRKKGTCETDNKHDGGKQGTLF